MTLRNFILTDTRVIRILISLVLLPLIAAAQDIGNDADNQIKYFSSENILKFADHLYDASDYQRAAGEYRRYLIAVSFEPSSDSIYYKAIRALFFDENYEMCHEYLDSYRRHYPESRRLPDIDLLKAVVYNKQDGFKESIEYASRAKTADLPLKTLVLAAANIRLGQFEKALELSCSFERRRTTPPSAALIQLDNLCEKLKPDALNYKSPTLAATLAIIPGAGKLYCGNAGDALNSMLLIGLFGYLAYDGFHDDGERSTRGWIFGTLGFGFYAGNIYGSAIAARLYNKRVRDDFILGLDIDVSIP
jgi:tetratricopeptide (TPR) repeat protein